MKTTNRKTILVTGCSSGIGKACAVHFALKGCRVFAGIRREEDATRLRQISSHLHPIRLDVTQPDQVREALHEVQSITADRRLDGLINNAGTAFGGPLEYLPLEMFRAQLELNVTGQQLVTQTFLPLVRRAEGRIVFMSSVSGMVARPFLGSYCASKFALEALADSYRAELAPWNIRVSVIQPGTIRTAIWKKGQRQTLEVANSLNEEGRKLYGNAYARHMQMTSYALTKMAIEPEKVVRCLSHALFASNPKTRYRVGPGTTLDFILRNFVSDSIRDVVLRALVNWLTRPGKAGKTH